MSDSTPPYDQVIYIINNGGSGNYVAVQGSLALQDEPIVLHAKTGMDNQMWYLRQKDGKTLIQSAMNPSYYLGFAAGEPTAPGAYTVLTQTPYGFSIGGAIDSGTFVIALPTGNVLTTTDGKNIIVDINTESNEKRWTWASAS